MYLLIHSKISKMDDLILKTNSFFFHLYSPPIYLYAYIPQLYAILLTVIVFGLKTISRNNQFHIFIDNEHMLQE